jgi:hypothetical protein
MTVYAAVAEDGTEVKMFSTRKKALDEFDINKEVAAVFTLPGRAFVAGNPEIDIDEALLEQYPGKQRGRQAAEPREPILPEDVTVEVKTCTRCREEKVAEAFGFQKSSKDGLRHWCKQCVNEYTRGWRVTRTTLDEVDEEDAGEEE